MGFRKLAGILIVTVLAGSVGMRAVVDRGERAPDARPTPAAATNRTPAGGSSFVAGGGTSAAPTTSRAAEPVGDGEGEPGLLFKSLPFLTEASFFALIGYALGYFSRKLVKVGLILLAVLFIALQGLSYLDIVRVDWSRALDVVNNLVLNLKQDQTIGEMLKNRLPSAGGLLGGFALGYRKG